MIIKTIAIFDYTVVFILAQKRSTDACEINSFYIKQHMLIMLNLLNTKLLFSCICVNVIKLVKFYSKKIQICKN